MRAVLRFISLILIVMGIVLLGADALASLDGGGRIVVRSTDQLWAMVSPGGLAAFKVWLQHQAPWAAQGVQAVLNVWGWALTGILGVVLNFASGRNEAV